MQRTCERCGKTYEAARSTSKFCSSTCRAAVSLARKAGEPVQLLPQPEPSADGGSLTSATIAELAAADRVDCTLGQAAIALARRVDAGHESGSSVAALVRELRVTLEAALDGAARADDVVDELRRKREQLRRRHA